METRKPDTGEGMQPVADEQARTASGGQPKKKSGLAITMGQKPAKKGRIATSEPDSGKVAQPASATSAPKEKAAPPPVKPEAASAAAATPKKKGGGLSISSKVRRPEKKPEATAKKPPIPPVAQNPEKPETKKIPAGPSPLSGKKPQAPQMPPPVVGKPKPSVDEKSPAADGAAPPKMPPPVVGKTQASDEQAVRGKAPPAAPAPQTKPPQPAAPAPAASPKPKTDGKPAPAAALPKAAGKPAAAPAEEVTASSKTEPPRMHAKSGEPETLLSLLVPDPEEVTKLKQGTKQDRYLSQSVVLEESGLSTLVRSSILLVAVLLMSFFIWAAYSTVDEMASTTGQVIPNTPVQVIQHLEGGIIEEIFVKEGQIVKKGGQIARLSPKAALADLNQMRAKLASLTAQKARLIAMIEGEGADFSSIPAQYGAIIQGQIKLLNAQRNNFESKLSVTQNDIERARVRLENILDQQESLQRQIAFAEQEVQVQKLGYEKGLMSRLNVIAAERDKNRVESELVRVIGELVGARKDLTNSNRELEKLIDTTREENLRELEAVTSEYSQVVEGIARLEDRVSRLEIYSPVWGIIKELSLKTVGGVIGPGSVLTEIIPLDKTRRVEVKISTKDIGHVSVGQGVTVKISTYDYARYGGIEGVLESISPTTFEDPSGDEPYYLGIVRLDKSHVGGDPNKNLVLPGMTVQASIHTGSKTIMEYLLKPIYASINKSFQER